VKRKQRTREEKEEEKLGRLATDISATDGVQVSGKDRAAASGFKRIQASHPQYFLMNTSTVWKTLAEHQRAKEKFFLLFVWTVLQI
jgi:hypothetical protein